MAIFKNLTTGVLAKDATTIFAGVAVANLDPTDTMIANVYVIDWSSGSQSAVPLTSSPPNPISVSPKTLTKVTASLPAELTFYEIRIYYQEDDDLTFNCYGLTTGTTPWVFVPGNTVLHHELNESEIL